jgi:phosphopantothenoylcysteine decarboxylase/phosphopantothenate--cysteine ligase
VADYTLEPEAEKIKSGSELVLRLGPTKKIIKTVRAEYPDLLIVGFKAETNIARDELLRRAAESMQSNSLDLVVANDVGSGGIGESENSVIILDREGRAVAVQGRKSLIAGRIIDALVEAL